MKHHLHIIRACCVVIAVLMLGFIVRPFFIPSSFGKYGSFRGDHIDEERSARPITYDDKYCLRCHEERLSKGKGGHANVPCVDCHFLSVPHAEGEDREFLEIIKKNARNTSKLVFQALYTVMSKGWDKEKISNLLEKINRTNPGMTIRIFRGDPVIREFGDIEGQREIREQDPDILKALREGSEVLTSLKENNVRYIYPVIAEKDCLNCHQQGKPGDINGAIDVTFPVYLNETGNEKKSISEIVREDAKQAADLVFESLLMVMERGWNSGQIREMIEKLDKNDLNMSIRFFRSRPLEQRLGVIEGEREIREKTPEILKALREGGNTLFTDKKDNIRFLYPIKMDAECSNCHGKFKTGDILGLLDVTFPAKRLKIHGLDKLADMPIDRSQRTCTICHEYLPSRPKDFPQQVVAQHLEEAGMEEDTLCVECHDPHVPGME